MLWMLELVGVCRVCMARDSVVLFAKLGGSSLHHCVLLVAGAASACGVSQRVQGGASEESGAAASLWHRRPADVHHQNFAARWVCLQSQCKCVHAAAAAACCLLLFVSCSGSLEALCSLQLRLLLVLLFGTAAVLLRLCCCSGGEQSVLWRSP